MIVMNEQVISSSEEVSYENLDILDCAVVTADLDLDEEDPQSLNQFNYQWNHHTNYHQLSHHQIYEEEILQESRRNNSRSAQEINCEEVSTTCSTTSNDIYPNSVSSSSKIGRKYKKKSTYKHVPHSAKPPQVVAKRNARERKRVHAVNQAFVKLRKALPFENKRGKRISKVRVLQRAIDYIKNLHDMVLDHDGITNVNHNYYHSDTDSSLFAF